MLDRLPCLIWLLSLDRSPVPGLLPVSVPFAVLGPTTVLGLVTVLGHITVAGLMTGPSTFQLAGSVHI